MLNTSEPTTSSFHSRAMFQAAVVLSHKYNITIEGQFIDWQSVQTGGDEINAFSNTCLLISNSNIVGIVGPALSRESRFIAPLAAKIGIPVISYASTDPELSDRNTYSTFYRTVPPDNAAALAIAKLFIRFNWTSCIIIYQNDAFGSGGAKAITETFEKNNLKVIEMIVFDIATRTIRGDLKGLLTSSSSRIVLLWTLTDYTALVLQNALDNNVVGPQFTWILSSNVPLNSFNQTLYNKLIGMFLIEPAVGNFVNAPINTTLLNAAYAIWQQYEPDSFPGPENVDYYGLFAFDATWTLIQSLQQFCSRMSNNSSSCISFINNSFCFDQRLLNSRAFFDIINNNTFLGVSGSLKFSVNVTDRINGTYYVAKNVQRSSSSLKYVPVLVWSDSNGWRLYKQTNAIVWPDNSLIPPSGYAAISGINLRIAVIVGPPFTMSTEVTDIFGQTTKKLIGYVPDLIELLQKTMEFIPNIILLPSNESYNGLIDAVANDVYDMVVADVTITAERREKVSFSSSIFDNSLRVMVREASIENVDLLSYLRPFSFKLWITLLAATIYAGFLISLLELEHNEALRNKSISSLILKSMWYSIGTILGYGVDFNVRTAAGRLLTVGLYILSLVSVAAYTAKLASELTISKSKGTISGIDDIKNGKLSFSRIGIHVNTSIEDYYLREISGDSRNFYPLNSEEEMYNNLLNNIIDAGIAEAGVAEYAANNIYCNLTLVGTDFGKSAFGIVLQKNWLYQEYLDVNILSLRESGALENLKRKWFQTNSCSRSSTTSTSMTIESMTGLFLTFGVISVLSILLFVWKKRFIIKNYLLILTHRKVVLEK
jgi:ABC-type amino acid transport substrate-binding protein/ABC-type branched-subunit amino acid transport system substrate-binding protein